MIDIIYAGDGERLDGFITKIEDFSRSQIQKAIREGFYLVDGSVKNPSYKLKKGDKLVGSMPICNMLTPVDMNLDILYEDDYILIINKPYNLSVHPSVSEKNPTLVSGLLAYTNKLSCYESKDRPGIVHRLDKDTTGAIIVAKDERAHEILKEDFMGHRIKKTYLALVDGQIKENITINEALGRDPKTRVKMVVNGINAKEAITHIKVLAGNEKYSFIQVNIETGRTHQIRVHLSHIHHPIVGDLLYGLKKQSISVRRQMLHAYSISFNHPINKEQLTIKAKMDSSFEEGLKKAGFDICGQEIID